MNERHYFPTEEQQKKHGLITIESMRETMGEAVEEFTDAEMEYLRECFYKLAYFIYYDWIDSLNK